MEQPTMKVIRDRDNVTWMRTDDVVAMLYFLSAGCKHIEYSEWLKDNALRIHEAVRNTFGDKNGTTK